MGLAFGAVDCSVAIAAYRFQVCHIPRKIIEFSLADSDLKGADDMVNLVAGRDMALFGAFLAKSIIAL